MNKIVKELRGSTAIKLVLLIALFICVVLDMIAGLSLSQYNEKYSGDPFYNTKACKTYYQNYVYGIAQKAVEGQIVPAIANDSKNIFRIKVRSIEIAENKKAIYKDLTSNLEEGEKIDKNNPTFSELDLLKGTNKGYLDLRTVPRGNYIIEVTMDYNRIPSYNDGSQLYDEYQFYQFTKNYIKIWYNNSVWIIRISSFLGILFFIILIVMAGYKGGNDLPSENFFDRIPTDLWTVIIGASIFAVLYWSTVFYNYVDILQNIMALKNFEQYLWAFIGLGGVIYSLFMSLILSYSTRIKLRTFIKRSIIYKLMEWSMEVLTTIMENGNVMLLFIFGFSGYCLANYFLVARVLRIKGFLPGFMFITFNCIAFALCTMIISQYKTISKAAKKILSGDMDIKINTQKWFPFMGQLGNDIKNINDGLQNALDEQVKSERLKTELITNVSHDIKTPLTSIINYIDLLKKEELKNDRTAEYIKILEQKSQRLKTLTEDLVEASKISTHSIHVENEYVDLKELIVQTLGEHSGKFQGLDVIFSQPDEDVIIWTDGKYVWRIVENLFSNIRKYALPGTRAYIDLSIDDEDVVLEFKNTSKEKLNIKEEELMERFVRGDRSRNSEGSGLGLSIARSLTEILEGEFGLTIDGDLFKVTIKFKRCIKE